MSADNKTLASATSFTAGLSPGLEIGQHFFLSDSVLLELARNCRTQLFEKLPSKIRRKNALSGWQKHARHPATASDEDGLFGLQKTGRFVAKFSNSAHSHVVTPVTIIALGWMGIIISSGEE